MNGRELLKAVDGGDLAAVRSLWAGGADVNEVCGNGQTALMPAAAQGDLAPFVFFCGFSFRGFKGGVANTLIAR